MTDQVTGGMAPDGRRPKRLPRRLVLAGGAALALVGAGAVGAAQLTEDPIPPPTPKNEPPRILIERALRAGEPPPELTERRQTLLEGVARRLDVTTQQLEQALAETLPEDVLLPLPGGLIPATGVAR